MLLRVVANQKARETELKQPESWSNAALSRKLEVERRLRGGQMQQQQQQTQTHPLPTEPKLPAQQALKRKFPTKPKGRKVRSKVEITAEVNAKIDHKLANRKNKKARKRHDQAAQHYIDFMQGNGWSELIEDPTGLEAGNKLKRYLAYEAEVFGLKGGSIRQKAVSIDKFHVKNGKLPPFKLCMLAMEYLDELIRDDAAAQPRIPVPAQITDLHELSNSILPECGRGGWV